MSSGFYGEDKCAFCWENYSDAAVLDCNHCFCFGCIKNMLLESEVCPLCNERPAALKHDLGNDAIAGPIRFNAVVGTTDDDSLRMLMKDFSVLVAGLVEQAEDEWMLKHHSYKYRAPTREELAALETLVSLHKKMVQVDTILQHAKNFTYDRIMASLENEVADVETFLAQCDQLTRATSDVSLLLANGFDDGGHSATCKLCKTKLFPHLPEAPLDQNERIKAMRMHIRDFHNKRWSEIEKTELALAQKLRDLVSSETFRRVVYVQNLIGKTAIPYRDVMLDITPDNICNNEAKIRARLEAFIERDRAVLSEKADLHTSTVADRVLNYLRRSVDRDSLDNFLVNDCKFVFSIDIFLENVVAFLQSGYANLCNFDMSAEFRTGQDWSSNDGIQTNGEEHILQRTDRKADLLSELNHYKEEVARFRALDIYDWL